MPVLLPALFYDIGNKMPEQTDSPEVVGYMLDLSSFIFMTIF